MCLTPSETVDLNAKSYCSEPVADDIGCRIPQHVWRIHGRDYDLSSWVNQHPGGAYMILLGKGTDCTLLFESYHIINEPRKRLRAYDVTPDGLAPPVPECPSEFFRDVRAMVREHFASGPRYGHKATNGHFVRVACVFVCELVAACWWISQRSLFGALVTGYMGWLMMANLAHDCSHGALSRRAVVNYVGGFIGSFPFGWSVVCWWLQHVVSHHQYTNELGHDVDAHHQCFARWHRAVQLEIIGGRLLGGLQQIFWHIITTLGSTVGMTIIHPVQFIWLPLLAHINGGQPDKFYGEIGDAETPRHGLFCPTHHDGAFGIIGGNFARQRALMHSPLMLAATFLCWLFSLVVLWAPFFYDISLGGSVGHALLMGMIPFMTSSLWFMAVTQISHIQEVCQADAVTEEPDYFKRQAQTSMDYSTGSNIVAFLTGSLNVQSIHHAVPSISSVHYSALYPKFHAICIKHKCEPAHCPSIAHALYRHWCYIWKLGSDSVNEVERVQRPAETIVKGSSQDAALKLI